MSKGKTPSLIGSSLGRPEKKTAGRRSPCSRCEASILLGDTCYDVPQPSKSFPTPRRFCVSCFRLVLQQTKLDLAGLDALLP